MTDIEKECFIILNKEYFENAAYFKVNGQRWFVGYKKTNYKKHDFMFHPCLRNRIDEIIERRAEEESEGLPFMIENDHDEIRFNNYLSQRGEKI